LQTYATEDDLREGFGAIVVELREIMGIIAERGRERNRMLDALDERSFMTARLVERHKVDALYRFGGVK
jgi:hypothetical protein